MSYTILDAVVDWLDICPQDKIWWFDSALHLKMTIQTYIDSIMNEVPVEPALLLDKKPDDIQEYIYACLTSKKFRKTKMHESCVLRTKKAIDTNVTQNKPIRVVFPQGGYKLWRFPSSPNPDWAEVFNIRYLIEYCIQSHKHTNLVFSSCITCTLCSWNCMTISQRKKFKNIKMDSKEFWHRFVRFCQKTSQSPY